MRKRVVVTGVGSVNPMGHNVEEVWSGLKEGKSGVGFTTIFVILGATATAAGQLMVDNLSLLGKIAGVVIIIAGLHFLGRLVIDGQSAAEELSWLAAPLVFVVAAVLASAIAAGRLRLSGVGE
jgi:cytochrome c biogenesis protein CcdA